ncbi:MAG: NADH-quinone oxidoreductase subunit C [Pseudonocardiaceae bacterium]
MTESDEPTTTSTPQPGVAQSSAEREEAGLEPRGAEPARAVAAGHERQGMFGVSGTGDTSGFGGLRLPAYTAPASERPFGGWFDEFADEFSAALSDNGIPAGAIQQVTVDHGEITFYVQREHLLEICRTLRNDAGLRFELCSSVSGVDYGPDVPQRLHSVYHLTSMTYRKRIRLEVCVDWPNDSGDDPWVPSIVEVYPTADWQERESWDMFGIVYAGHPALTRILMPDDWDGHPQRKDYPLGGIPVEYKGTEIPPPEQRRAYS